MSTILPIRVGHCQGRAGEIIALHKKTRPGPGFCNSMRMVPFTYWDNWDHHRPLACTS